MPTDLSMERRGINGTNPYLTSIKTENMASWLHQPIFWK
jgi:hypothetical protein